jgi:hypothetical protein
MNVFNLSGRITLAILALLAGSFLFVLALLPGFRGPAASVLRVHAVRGAAYCRRGRDLANIYSLYLVQSI